MLIWTLEMYLYCLVLMIHTYLNLCSPFGFDLWSCAFYFMYMCILPNLKIYMYNSWVFCLQCKSIHIDSLEFKRYVCIFHVLSKHTYILTYRFCFQWFNKKNVRWFWCLWFSKEYCTLLPFSWCHVSHNISTLTSFETIWTL